MKLGMDFQGLSTDITNAILFIEKKYPEYNFIVRMDNEGGGIMDKSLRFGIPASRIKSSTHKTHDTPQKLRQ